MQLTEIIYIKYYCSAWYITDTQYILSQETVTINIKKKQLSFLNLRSARHADKSSG